MWLGLASSDDQPYPIPDCGFKNFSIPLSSSQLLSCIKGLACLLSGVVKVMTSIPIKDFYHAHGVLNMRFFLSQENLFQNMQAV